MTKKCVKCIYNNPEDFTLNFKIDSEIYCDNHAIYVIKNSGNKNVYWRGYIFKLLEYMNLTESKYHV